MIAECCWNDCGVLLECSAHIAERYISCYSDEGVSTDLMFPSSVYLGHFRQMVPFSQAVLLVCLIISYQVVIKCEIITDKCYGSTSP